MDNYGKLENLERNCFYRIMFFCHRSLGIRAKQVIPGSGDFVSFFLPGGWSFALKSCPGGGDFNEKISGPAVSPGGGW